MSELCPVLSSGVPILRGEGRICPILDIGLRTVSQMKQCAPPPEAWREHPDVIGLVARPGVAADC